VIRILCADWAPVCLNFGDDMDLHEHHRSQAPKGYFGMRWPRATMFTITMMIRLTNSNSRE
jgi:hypothetical protein